MPSNLASKQKIYSLTDKDDLSRETYNGGIIEAEKLSHDLTLHYGLLSSDCENETVYINKTEKFTREIL